ncbi:MAG TPA: hypothetical protein VHS96_01405, partial [Bacteroidia bacterium]|nr:hypothetical protein [Bacteroidia bacterium]
MTLNVFVVTPTGKAAPLAKPVVCVVVGLGQLSVPTGVEYDDTAEHNPEVAFKETFEGQVITGICASVTVTVKEQVAVFPAPSVTRKVLVVTPTGKEAP